MPEIPFVTLNIISDYDKRTQREIITQRQIKHFSCPYGTANCRQSSEDRRDPVHLPSGTTGSYFKIST
jgi:hypothetical protein